MKSYWRACGLGGVWVAAVALALQPAGAQTSKASAAAATTVTNVAVARDGQQTVVRVEGRGGRLSYQVLRLADPPRVVLDFEDAALSFPRNAVPSDYEPVRSVRLGQSQPDRVRVVIDLAKRSQFEVQESDRAVQVTFAAPSGTAVVPAAVADAAYPLPASLTEPAAALARPEPQQVAAAMAPAPVAPAAAQEPAAAAAQAAAPAYTGEPISVNLRDVDLRDFFRLIHEISGLNVVLDPSVSGSVTLVLDEVPWDQALDIVLRNNGLSKELNGNVLRIVTDATLRREAETRRDLARAQAEAIELVTTTRVLSYAKATELQETLRRFLSPRGEIFSDVRSNSLIIRDVPASLPQVDNLIRQLDRKSMQVEIEARVVAASRAFARDIGTQFAFSTSATGGRNVWGGALGASPIERALPPPLSFVGNTASMPLVSNFPANSPTSGISFLHSSPNFALDYIITAAESRGVGKLLSSPHLVTQNNAMAVVKQGTKIPIQTTINNTVSVQYVDAVLQLQVTPQITAEGTIFMDVLVENTAIDQGIPRVQGIPALNTQSAQTKVLIGDGGTVVVGGVIVSSQRTDVQQVPLVGSIPLIGHLFKRTSVNVQSQELLFFLTPRLLPG